MSSLVVCSQLALVWVWWWQWPNQFNVPLLEINRKNEQKALNADILCILVLVYVWMLTRRALFGSCLSKMLSLASLFPWREVKQLYGLTKLIYIMVLYWRNKWGLKVQVWIHVLHRIHQYGHSIIKIKTIMQVTIIITISLDIISIYRIDLYCNLISFSLIVFNITAL